MLKGVPKEIEWKKYAVQNFKFPIKLPDTPHDYECGAMSLYALTKINYEKIMKLSKKGHWSTKTMVDFLRKNKYTVIPVTLGNTVNAYQTKNGYDKNILSIYNVLLIGQGFFRHESSWAVTYNNLMYHSGDVETSQALIFINYPIMECYLIWHPSWK